MVRIKKFGVLQTAIFMAVLYFIMSFVFVIPMVLFMTIAGSASGAENALMGGLLGGMGMLLIPFIYAIIGFIFVAIGCLVYNLVAHFVGGIEVELEEK